MMVAMSLRHRATCVGVAAIAASVVLTACGSSSGAKVTPTTGAPAARSAAVFTLAEGVEHDACGIGVGVTFIASAPGSGQAGVPVLVGGPIGTVVDSMQDLTGDQPLPADAAHLTQGTVATVDGKRFGVNSIDTTGSSVQLTALC
jgi:hypothetical protein